MSFSTLVAILASALACAAQTTVVVNGTASHNIPETLWGLMFEDISHSGDGGLYGELLQNRAFQEVTPGTVAALAAWTPVGGASIAVIADSTPLSSALPNALQIIVPDGVAGVGNMGFWGINVNASWTYNASFFFRFPDTLPSSDVTATASLVSASGGTVFASANVSLSPTADWTQVFTTLTPSASAPDTLNNFTVTFKDFSGTINTALFSLFPPTFMGQENGMRADIAQALLDLGPSFFRFPGGNNIEGNTIATRWQWNNTVGPLTSRPGREGTWSYINTDGLGLYEYLVWIELMGMQPIMAIWSGFSLGGQTVANSPDALAPYIEQARQQIEFVVGNTSTPGGALRASLGHPEPFTLNFVEVGNEDQFAPSTYLYRWPAFMNALQPLFPDIRFLATTFIFNPVLGPTPQSYDSHMYDTPDWFAKNSIMYDGFLRNGTTYFEGEYAAISVNPSDLFGTPANGRFTFPTMNGSVGEAAFMMGLERNADIVFAASYAPLLGHVTQNQWTPNLLAFDAGAVIKSTSYYVQQMFSLNRGDAYLPSTRADPSGTLFWSVVQQNAPPAFIIKLANTGADAANVTFQLPAAVKGAARLVQISGNPTDSNTPESPDKVVPVTSSVDAGQDMVVAAPGFSVSVVTVPIA
ncbi:glycoside hydrolase [Vararia minispora EC-137]|uniref:Glycoside hydrolase n=1 Tax=Vararia minispora EC-137 TaxID=1314806 RepID=A0ACB8QFB3_9AGAM|nr:glycoside hydrolase [Vararia minispora EC-137]